MQITPVTEIPFKGPDGYYCNSCSSYSQDFYHSAIRTGYRRCRGCHRAQLKLQQSQKTKVEKLAKKLQYNFKYQRRPEFAKGVTTQHVMHILKNQGIEYEDQLDLVKTITPCHDPITQQWNFKVVFKSGAAVS